MLTPDEAGLDINDIAQPAERVSGTSKLVGFQAADSEQVPPTRHSSTRPHV